MNYYISVLTKNYANFNGRARRLEYWMFVLFNIIVGVILAVLAAATNLVILPGIYSLAIMLPTVALSVRRLHDISKSGAWLLILFIPLVGGIWFLILTCTEGTAGANEYGEHPKIL